MNGWRAFNTAAQPDGLALTALLVSKICPGLPASSLIFDTVGPDLYAQCLNADHVPPEPSCGCGLYFWPGPLPVDLLRGGVRAPVLAEVKTQGPILSDPLITQRSPWGLPQRAAGLRLRQLWVAPNTSIDGLWRHGVPVTPWRTVDGRTIFDELEAV